MYLGSAGPLPEFDRPRDLKKEDEDIKSKEGRTRWRVAIILFSLLVIGSISFIQYESSPDSYDKDTRECFSRLTTLDHSLLQESDANALVKEIKKDIVKNHLTSLCGWTYDTMDRRMIRIFFPNVLFDPTGI